MRAHALGVIVEVGPDSKLHKGDYVSGILNMTEYAVIDDSKVEKLTYVCLIFNMESRAYSFSEFLLAQLYWIT